MFTIDFVTGRDSDNTPAKTVTVSRRPLDGVTILAGILLAEIVAGAPANGPPVIGYLIRDEAGTVVHRLYRGLG